MNFIPDIARPQTSASAPSVDSCSQSMRLTKLM